MEISKIFELLQAQGVTKSQMEFSRIWLGRSARYYSHLVATGREPGLATLCALNWRLGQIAASLKGDQRKSLLELQQTLLLYIERRAVTDIRPHRPRQSDRQDIVNSMPIKKLSTALDGKHP